MAAAAARRPLTMRPRLSGDLSRTALAALAVLVPALLLFYGPGIVTGRELFFTHDINGSDLWHLHVPLKSFYSHELRQGRLPYWCNTIGTGFPLLAEGQVGALYPPNLILFRLLPFALAFNGAILFHLILAGLSCALLARRLGSARGPSVLSGLVFAFSGFLTVHLKHINMDACAAWCPLLLLLVDRYAGERKARTAALAAIVVALMLLAGHPQIVYVSLLVAIPYAVTRWLRPWPADAETRPSATSLLRLGTGLGLAIALGAALAAPQLLPTFELNRLGPRAKGLGPAEAFEYEMAPIELITFVAPKVFGDPGTLRETAAVDPVTHALTARLRGFTPPRGARAPFWEITGYVGLLPLGLAAGGLLFGLSRREIQPIAGVLVISVLLALGTHGGLGPLCYRILPGFRYFRFQSRFLLFADLALALLAGWGLTRAIDRLTRSGHRRMAAAAVPLCLVVSFLDLRHALGDQNPRIDAGRWTTAPRSLERIERARAGATEPYRIADVDPGNSVFVNAYHRARGWTADLSPYDDAKEMIGPNLNALYGVDNINFYFYIYPERVRLGAVGIRAGPESEEPARIAAKLASLFNVRYFLTPQGALPGAGERVDEIQAGSTIGLYENRAAFPRAFLVPRARYVPALDGIGPPSEESALALLRDTAFDAARNVLIEGAPEPGDPRADGPDGTAGGTVRIVSYEPQEVRLEVSAAAPCWLFLGDTYYPGWSARIDGRPVRVRAGNVVGRAIPIPGGNHSVVFAYRPTGGLWGWVIACAAGVLLCVCVVVRPNRVVA